MSRSRLIRTLVNLSLIVVMTIHPMVALALTQRCGTQACCVANSQTHLASPQCKCCQAKQPAVSASCCIAKAPPNPDPPCCRERQMGSSDADLHGGEVRSLCRCAEIAPPLSDSSPKRPTSENRAAVAIGPAPLPADEDRLHTNRSRFAMCASTLRLTHFSQLLFCSWRL